MRFGTWNVRSLCRVGAIKSVAEELERRACGREEVFIGFWLGSPKVGKRPLGRPRLRWEDKLSWILGSRDRRGELDSAGSG
jgi:hypothetical protein